MSQAAARRPIPLILLGIAGWLVFTLLAVNADESGYWWSVAADACRALAAVFAALALGGGLLEFWARTEWRTRTQWIAVDMLDRTMRRLAAVAASARAVPPLVDDDAALAVPVDDVFRLPWSMVKHQAVSGEADARSRVVLGWVVEHRGDGKPESMGASLDRLGEASDALWEVARDLSGYLDQHHGMQVLSRVSQLHDSVRRVVDPTPGETLRDADRAALAATGIRKLFEALSPVAEAISAAHEDVRRHVNDKDLDQQLQSLNDGGNDSDVAIRTWLQEASERREAVEGLNQAADDFLTSGEDARRSAQEVLDDPHASEEDRQVAQQALAEIRRISEEVLQTMRTESGEEPR